MMLNFFSASQVNDMPKAGKSFLLFIIFEKIMSEIFQLLQECPKCPGHVFNCFYAYLYDCMNLM